jgi:predicted DNA-binding transcriptional regulator AlpA
MLKRGVRLLKKASRMNCDLYRHFDKDGRLLYVGVSFATFWRLNTHRNEATWYHEIRTITIDKFASRGEAMKAEAVAIRDEKPLNNKICNVNGRFNIREDKLWLSLSDIAVVLGVTRKTVYRKIERGELPLPFKDIKPARWLKSEFMKWFDDGQKPLIKTIGG